MFNYELRRELRRELREVPIRQPWDFGYPHEFPPVIIKAFPLSFEIIHESSWWSIRVEG